MTLTHTDLDSSTLRRAFGQFPSGVVAICAEIAGEPTAMAASSFVGVSFDPPLVGVCVQNVSTTWPKLRQAQRIGVSVLGEAHDGAARTLAAKGGNRFEGLATTATDEGAVFVGGACAWLDVTVTEEVPAGDHAIVLMKVNEVDLRDEMPIVFHRSRFNRLREIAG
ncbi:flavin reductase family protein [Tomitella gaofuii]|uniref:flavin reductase family protein n=1 Tax=Tomitella gaofuii TaxID=2760083 RepID=UPI0015FA6CBA|nr:flavin reductase family protein [Tomitella gaofuii]